MKENRELSLNLNENSFFCVSDTVIFVVKVFDEILNGCNYYSILDF